MGRGICKEFVNTTARVSKKKTDAFQIQISRKLIAGALLEVQHKGICY